MKTLVLLFLLTIPFIKVYSQEPIPESNFDLSVGVGQPFGGIGVKALIGDNGTGIVMGLGQIDRGMLAYTIGGQIGTNSIFFSVNYGVIGLIQINDEPVQRINAASILMGGKLGFGKAKRVFVEIAVGHSFGAPKTIIGHTTYSNDAVCFNFGIGYRIPKSKKKSAG